MHQKLDSKLCRIFQPFAKFCFNQIQNKPSNLLEQSNGASSKRFGDVSITYIFHSTRLILNIFILRRILFNSVRENENIEDLTNPKFKYFKTTQVFKRHVNLNIS